jgi:glutamate-1-semialdehyde 2,1-aminomutase
MSVATLPNATLAAAYEAATPGSGALARKARALLPSGIVHDSRHFDPYPIYVARAQGPLKWDVDGNRYVDYYGGHGALLLGHNHPKVMEAVHAQLDRGTHFGACHELEVKWAELICRMVPSAERVRFTSSGTEATLMALRLARAFTGRDKLVRVRGHFHGWHDHMTMGHANHFDGTPTAGVTEGVAQGVLLVDPNDMDGLARLFARHKDIAAAILEPTGASFGRMPLKPGFIAALRDLTRASGAMLIFDEVVTGFRCAPGGAQQALGITPDLTALAKILAGGLPGGAVAGRKDVLDLLDFAETRAKGLEKIYHPGTFNANPTSAAAGVAALEIIATTDACDRANAYGADLRRQMNAVLAEERVNWAVYGTYSGFHVFTNPTGAGIDRDDFDAIAHIPAMLSGAKDPVGAQLRLGLLVNGVDVNPGPAGTISATHGPEELRATVDGFRATLRALKREGKLT